MFTFPTMLGNLSTEHVYKAHTSPSSKLRDYIGTMHLTMHLSQNFYANFSL